jgi:hypothetical protein
MLNHLKYFSLFFLFFISSNIYSQEIEFGIGGGITHFKGDITPKFDILQPGIGANGFFRYNFSKSVSGRANLMVGKFNASDYNSSDPFYLNRGAEISGKFIELSAIAEFNFLDRSARVKAVDWTPYLFGGVGLMKGKTNSLPISSAVSSYTTPILPYGVGIKYRFKGPWTISAEFGTRFVIGPKADLLDLNFGTKFGNLNPIPSGNPNNDRLNESDLNRKDQYYYTNIGISYTIFKVACPQDK